MVPMDRRGTEHQLNERGAHSTDVTVKLSVRESEVFKWMCVGKTNWEIGIILGISSWTVKIHVHNILKKLMVENRVQAIVLALRRHPDSEPL